MSDPVARTIKDFCAAYGISRSTVYELLAQGKLASVKVGTRTLIPEASARAWFSTLGPTRGPAADTSKRGWTGADDASRKSP